MSKTAKKGASSSATATAVRLGIDLGTNSSVVAAAHDGKPVKIEDDVVRSVVGFPKAGIIPGILPNDSEVLFGDEAIDYRLHLDLKWPLNEGVVDDLEVARTFAGHLRSIVDKTGKNTLWGVVGAPANATAEQQKALRSTMAGVLERLLVVPEPFLAAMGLRDDSAFTEKGGDPTKHSLIVDIGGGTTDLCLVRGYFPTADDQISYPQAGGHIDHLFSDALGRRYPDLKLTPVTITQLKEEHSFVPGFEREAKVKVYVDGRPQLVDFTAIIAEACGAMVPIIVDGIKELLTRCDSDSIVNVMENIIVTGGGSQIHGITEKIQEVLVADGYDCARTIRPSDYKRLVAQGALRIAENVRDEQWQVPM